MTGEKAAGPSQCLMALEQGPRDVYACLQPVTADVYNRDIHMMDK